MTYKKQEELVKLYDHVDIDVRFLASVPDSRQLSIWYTGVILTFTWKRYEVTIEAYGDNTAVMYETDSAGNRHADIYKRKGNAAVLPKQAVCDKDIIRMIENHRKHKPNSLCLQLTANQLLVNVRDCKWDKYDSYISKSRNVFITVEEVIKKLAKEMKLY